MRGALRYLWTGVDKDKKGGYADGSLDAPGMPALPIATDMTFAVGIPWYDGQEDPAAPGLDWSSAEPHYPVDDEGALPIAGAYDGAYNTRGPVVNFGHEVSGGPYGDQALGKRQVFLPYVPERYDANGVQVGDYADVVAAAVAAGNIPQPDESEYLASILPNI